MRWPIVGAAILLLPGTLAAQRLPVPLPVVQTPVAVHKVPAPDDPAGAVLGGTIGGLTGATAFGFAYAVLNPCHSEECSWDGFAAAVTIGFPLGAATGAWLGNGRRGSFAIDALATMAFGTAELYAAQHIRNSIPFALAIPLAQVGVAALVERATGAGHAPRDSITVRPDR